MKKVLKGKVVSNNLEKTVAVEIERIYVVPVYEKRLKRKKKFLADNQIGAETGDLVEIGQSRPISKRKRWRVVKILSHVAA